MPPEPVVEDRSAVRAPAPEADRATPVAAKRVAVPATDSVDSSVHRAQVRARTVLVMHWSFIAVRVLTFVGLLVLAYVAISDNWLAQAADALVTWYNATVAPHMEIDLTPRSVPSLYDGLFGPIPQPIVVLD